jgi:hypothetical protein
MVRRRPPDFIEEIKAKQRNTVWPEMQENSQGVDSLIFLGDRNATPVQRIGIELFGTFFVLAGIAFIGIGRDLHSIAPFLLSRLWRSYQAVWCCSMLSEDCGSEKGAKIPGGGQEVTVFKELRSTCTRSQSTIVDGWDSTQSK